VIALGGQIFFQCAHGVGAAWVVLPGKKKVLLSRLATKGETRLRRHVSHIEWLLWAPEWAELLPQGGESRACSLARLSDVVLSVDRGRHPRTRRAGRAFRQLSHPGSTLPRGNVTGSSRKHCDPKRRAVWRALASNVSLFRHGSFLGIACFGRVAPCDSSLLSQYSYFRTVPKYLQSCVLVGRVRCLWPLHLGSRALVQLPTEYAREVISRSDAPFPASGRGSSAPAVVVSHPRHAVRQLWQFFRSSPFVEQEAAERPIP
jgi:hypothetical protein